GAGVRALTGGEIQAEQSGSRSTIVVQVAPSTTDARTERSAFVPDESIRLSELLFPRIDHVLKRVLDLTLASVGLVLVMPLLVVIALAVKLSSRGPVVYRSIRPGVGCKPFPCFKFRTMREHAD